MGIADGHAGGAPWIATPREPNTRAGERCCAGVLAPVQPSCSCVLIRGELACILQAVPPHARDTGSCYPRTEILIPLCGWGRLEPVLAVP